MRKVYTATYFIFFLFISALLCSCSSGGKLASSFGKRKYKTGYYFNFAQCKVNRAGAEARHYNSIASGSVSKSNVIAAERKELAVKPVEVLRPVQINRQPSTLADAPAQASVKTLQQVVAPQTNFVKDNSKGDHDWEENERRDRKINIELAVVSILAGIGGMALLGVSFGAGAACIVLGMVLSVIGLKRGSSSFLTFIGFLINVIGLVVLIDYVIVVGI